MTTLQAYCAPEYTLTAMLAGTYSAVAVPVLQGAIEADPKAPLPIEVRLMGRLMLSRPVQPLNALLSMDLIPGKLILVRLLHKAKEYVPM